MLSRCRNGLPLRNWFLTRDYPRCFLPALRRAAGHVPNRAISQKYESPKETCKKYVRNSERNEFISAEMASIYIEAVSRWTEAIRLTRLGSRWIPRPTPFHPLRQPARLYPPSRSEVVGRRECQNTDRERAGRTRSRASNVLSPSTLAPEVILAIQMDTRTRKLP